MITWFQMRNNKFHSLTTSFENVVIDVGGAQDYVPVVDEKKRQIKEVYHAVKTTLAWTNGAVFL
jgi:hypothetical protein